MCEDWIPTRAAADILNITTCAANSLARRGKLTRKIERGNALFLASSVFSLADKRQKRREERFDRRNSLTWWGDRTAAPEPSDGDLYITTREAASILGVHHQTVTHLVRRGLLPAYQKRPGQQGSPLMISAWMVRRLADRPEYQKRRRNTQHSGKGSLTSGWDHQCLSPVPRRGHTDHSTRDHGEFYSTRQVAALLGVHPTRVRTMAKTGRLTPIQLKARMKGPDHSREPATGNPWFFFRKEEVHALQADPEYCERHRRYIKGRNRTNDHLTPQESARLDRDIESCLRANRHNRTRHIELLDPADPPSYRYNADDWRLALE